MNRKEFVAGFLFSPMGTEVVLIHKNKGPKVVVGKWNGVGGKIEEGESPLQAMTREFEEETGVYIPDWRLYCEYRGEGFLVYFFKAFSVKCGAVKTVEEEEIGIHKMNSLPLLVDNLDFLLPLAGVPHLKLPLLIEEIW